MTKEESMRVLDYLGSIWPKAYSPNMKAERRTDLLDTLYHAMRSYAFSDVMEACRKIATEAETPPTIAGIRMECRQKTERKREPERVNLDGLPEHHPWRGCFTHHEALMAYMQDDAAGKRQGRPFSWYCRQYPAIEWRDWASPELCKDNWPYITRDNFAGWRTNEKGFCVPVAN